MEAKYTPGPWVAVEGSEAYGPWIILLPDAPLANHIAYISNGGVDEPQEVANARLIAAAPALVEALKEAQAFVSRDCQTLIESCSLDGATDTLDAGAREDVADYQAVLAKIDAALSQALGGE